MGLEKLLFGLSLALACHRSVVAGQIYVDANNTSGIEDGTIQHPYASIHSANNISANNDEIIVSPGVYEGSIEILKDITLRSENPTDSATVENTIIDSEDFGSGILLVGESGPQNLTCRIQGFTIANGQNEGGGIFCHPGGSPNSIIENNIIRDNYATGPPASIPKGGGIWGFDGIIQNNIFYGNMAVEGAALYQCNGIIRNNTFYGNTASEGPALYDCETAVIQNNIIWANIAYGVPGQIFNTSIPSYNCIQDVLEFGGNISQDPRFVNPLNNDFHLLMASPCIDAGSVTNLNADFEGNNRPHNACDWGIRGDGSHFDIGAFEFTGQVSQTSSISGWNIYH